MTYFEERMKRDWGRLSAPWSTRSSGVIATPHRDLGEDTYHELYVTDEYLIRSKAFTGGRKGQWWRWYYVVCNNPRCDSFAFIRADVRDDHLAALIPTELR